MDFKEREFNKIFLTLNKERFIEILSEFNTIQDLKVLRYKIFKLRDTIISSNNSYEESRDILQRDMISFRKDILISELNQILEARTIERARYYIKRLEKGTREVKTGKINDINLFRWKEYDEIITDSLWVMDKRDTSGSHLSWYWGNFIPQIPRQMMMRYTKKGDWVLDAFMGSGTTLIECRRLGRNGIGLELNPEVVEKARELIEEEENKFNTVSEVITGDNRILNINALLEKHCRKSVHLLIMHPPYHDIIKFSDDERDISNAKNTEDFLKMFGESLDNVTPYLEKGRYFILVIGDKYSAGEWIPLGFYCMNEVVKRGYSLKSTVVKNFDETRAKRRQKDLWRYRALSGGFYIFKHEYIMIFVKK